ncbi:MAG: shikimate kinase [Treponema sp.]
MKTAADQKKDIYSNAAACIYILTGLSRAGKTSAGSKAAVYTTMPFYDSDALCYEATQCTPRELYLQQGKTAFYRAEADALIHFFSHRCSEPCILALGGGFCDNPYAAYPKSKKVYPIFLDVSEDVLFTRLTDEAAYSGSYPAFLDALPLHQHTEARRLFSCLYAQRKQRYTASAACVLDVSALTVEETALQIAAAIEHLKASA